MLQRFFFFFFLTTDDLCEILWKDIACPGDVIADSKTILQTCCLHFLNLCFKLHMSAYIAKDLGCSNLFQG